MTSDDFLPQDGHYEEQTGGAGDGFPRIYWMNGVARDKTPGWFWMTDDRRVSADLTFGDEWKSRDHSFEGGGNDTIWYTPALYVAPIAWRQQTYIGSEGSQVERWITGRRFGKFADGERMAFEGLALVKGIEQPVVLGTKATKTSMAWLTDILPAYKKLRDEVRKTRNGAAVPPWWFWLAIRSARDPKGGPVYEKTKGRMVTPPIWIAPEDITSREAWKAIYVGNEIAAQGQTIYDSVGRDWATQPIGDSDAPMPAGRNVPQAIEEDAEIPF